MKFSDKLWVVTVDKENADRLHGHKFGELLHAEQFSSRARMDDGF